MTSQKQIAANRANSQKSSGPTSPAGKAKCRLNAVRDNITGQITTLSDEDRPIFEKLKAEHVADLAPKTISETKLAHAIDWGHLAARSSPRQRNEHLRDRRRRGSAG